MALEILYMAVITAIVAEFGHRVITFAVTGKGGVNDPLFLGKKENTDKEKLQHRPLHSSRNDTRLKSKKIVKKMVAQQADC